VTGFLGINCSKRYLVNPATPSGKADYPHAVPHNLNSPLPRSAIDATMASLKRRTLKKFQFKPTTNHHSVYVVLLKPAAAALRKVKASNPHRDPAKPCVYVGMTGLTPEERFANHKRGLRSSSFVKRFGVRLLPELYTHLNPMPYEPATQMEKDLTEDLRRAGYTVVGGH
jgi:hypothetical protein